MVGLYLKSTSVPYPAMTKDYSGQNLRGRSFKGQNLEGANFSGADIRGADFSNAILKEANFSRAHAGVSPYWGIRVGSVIVSLVLSALSGSVMVAGFLTAFMAICLVLITSKYNYTVNGLVLTVTATFAIAGSVALILGLVLSLIIAKTTFIFVARAGLIPPGVGVVGLVYTVLIGSHSGILSTATKKDVSGFLSWSIAIIDEFLKNTITNTGGTSFHGADLTNANFRACILKNTNFGKANVKHTKWFQSKNLDRARIGTTYLQNPRVRELLITGEGQNKLFDGLNLRGVNLEGANLTNASFMRANLNEANLQSCNFSRTKLKQTLLESADFTGATLTGATIEDWGITSHTKLHGVRCEYVFMRSPTPDDPNPRRKPDNWNENFADGDFADFIQPIFDTLDLYHNSGVDPRAIAIAFKQLAENNPDAELEIVAMEKRGSDKFLLRAKTAVTADKSELSAEYFDTYNQLKALPEREIKLLLAEKDSRIRSLETMVVTALERPNFYAETYNNQGDTMPKKESNFNLQGAQFGGGLVDAETVNAHQIGGNITNNAQEQPTETKNIDTKTILILAANAKTTPRLRLDEEVREIDAGLQRAKKRELFDLKQRWAVRVQDVYQSLLDFKPQIVHFSGHGAGDDGLQLEDETGKIRLVSTEALAKLFELFASNIECVVLNACYSEVQASAIAHGGAKAHRTPER
ncbi:pentapeptide repeat-containing protein [Tolypothrix sp. NIES-4075]|uniref:pentapeptide repeat-containing protein n=1 Tax=Tolypothrix sp. NIES-4075 TaxID=2005459 RepID=UPI000B74A640|nr:pentapeptide repeat-containing protein [Tolypothrix sp. NIES-4075]GAX45657.1 pentapeptide repeat-containing protein [Tolypothrix sp. NIES-4075]